MAAQKASLLLIKVHNGAALTAALGLRTKTMNLNSEIVDITHSESAGLWRELLEGGGLRTMDFTGAGVFTDAAVDGVIRAAIMSGDILACEVTVPGFGAFAGNFAFTQVQYAGEFKGEVTYNVTAQSSGEITFTAA